MLNWEDAKRFWSCVQFTDGCWVWTASRHKFGYGWFRLGGKLRTAHTVAFEDFHGPIPAGMEVCHHCDNPPCCRPDHCFIGTQADNMADMWNKLRGARGSTNGQAKLTESDIPMIVELYNGGLTQVEIGRRYGVDYYTIGKILRGLDWKHVPRAETMEMDNQVRGSRSHLAVLNEADIPRIRQLRKEGLLLRQIAEQYGITETTVSNIATGRTWKHLP